MNRLFGVILRAMKEYLKFKAGPGILNMIMEEGLKRERVRVFAGPAGGPKWFVSVGLDKAFIKTGYLKRVDGGKTLLAGSSAGAWRCLTMACKEPLEAYERLRIAYSRNIFTALDTPSSISAKLRANLNSFIRDEDIESITDNRYFNLAIHVVRSKGLAASSSQRREGLALLAAASMNVVSPRLMRLFYERVVFYSGEPEPAFLDDSFYGSKRRLEAGNVRGAALATGSLPYIISGVSELSHSDSGVYRDGGLLDYQLNQDYRPGSDGLTLFFHYQERIAPGWFDKKLTWRKPEPEALEQVLQIYPGRDFVDLLPDKRIPDRTDFTIFVDNPAERIRRWDEVSRLSGILADYFFETVESGKIRNLVQPL